MHITRIGIPDRLPPLENILFDCDERVNLFIGPNASGKSTILRLMESAYSHKIHRVFDVTGNYWDLLFARHRHDEEAEVRFHFLLCVDLSDDWPRISSGMIGVQWGETVPLLYIPATRTNLRGRDIFEQTIGKEDAIESDAPLKDLFDTDSGIFEGQYVKLAIDWLRSRITGNWSQQNRFRRALEVGYLCVKSICHEVIYDDAVHSYVELDDEYETSETGRIVHYGMGIGTSDDILGEPLYAGDLSSGTQGTLLWVWALALKMASHYEWAEGWEKKPAILLIDEIENHLHPAWQRRVIPALLKYFPGLQIFATTHSPFVVAGLKAGQVHLLSRDENGVVTATTNTEDVIGWTADEILRTMMGVEDPTDDKTAAAARELRQLRNEGPLSDPEDEKQRQERMQDLRQRVDRDLLAGGPWKKQRELFEEQFAEALEKYRQSQSLDQENG